MDPNECLRRIRALIQAFFDGEEGPDDGAQLAEYINGLDTWLTNGGFLPDEWQRLANWQKAPLATPRAKPAYLASPKPAAPKLPKPRKPKKEGFYP